MNIQNLFARHRLVLLAASLSVFQLNARAEEDAPPPSVQVHGYSTLGYSSVVRESNDPLGYNYGTMDKSGTYLYNSLVGLNLSYVFNDEVTFYGQMTALGSTPASGAVTQSYPVKMDMAFLNYHPTDWLDIRVGRQIMPTWMYSEQIDVGVTYPWIRPPSDVYNLAPMKSGTGVGLDFKKNLFDVVDVVVGARAGQALYNDDDAYANTANLNRVFIGFGEFSFNNMLKLRASYGTTVSNGTKVKNTAEIKSSIDGSSVLTAYGAAIAGGTAAAQAAAGAKASELLQAGIVRNVNNIYSTEFTFYSAGATFDFQGLQLIGEYAATNQRVGSIAAPDEGYVAIAPTSGTYRVRSWYTTAAYHLGDWTPHLTYSAVKKDWINGQNNEGKIYTNTNSGSAAMNPIIQAVGEAIINGAMAPYQNATQRMNTITAGLNYNFTPTIVGKVQWEQVRTWVGEIATPPPYVQFINGQQVASNNILNIAEAAVSFVF